MNAIQSQENADDSSGMVLAGNSGYEINNDRVVIRIGEIANRRDFENVSGTLSIELWALDQPYSGNDFSGIALAATTIGEIYGQHYLADCCYDLLFREPPEGTWFLALMLREWSENGYVTRDYVNFTVPYIVGGNPDMERSEKDNVIKLNFTDDEKKSMTLAVQSETLNESVQEETEADAVTISTDTVDINAESTGKSPEEAESKSVETCFWQQIRKFFGI